jgi:hemolysin type calcium-binding protein
MAGPAVAIVGIGAFLPGGAALAEDPVTCRGLTATIVTTEGPDPDVQGTNGPDVIATLGGNDDVDGNFGDDVICSGDGDDQLTGGGGDVGGDTLEGEAGADLLLGQNGWTP